MKRIFVISLRQHYLDQVKRFAPPEGASQPGFTVHPQDTYLTVEQSHYSGPGTTRQLEAIK
ncbi:protein of unknown function [Candidatus Promineifilum breve]|uniref:Uncharacterized protein n=1 Tax=Candidatus Promineifilum breve TaxID=1806508 RepID=A0A160T8M5_9CHLR|nr:protein of unknown function [Candidatus Promineifilum breve]